MKRALFIGTAALFSISVQAQKQHAKQDSTAKTLQEVVVTANKFPQKQSETGKLVDIITPEQLQNESSKSLGEVLNQEPGLMINGADNTLGSVQSIYMEGASPGNTLILLDGVPLYDPSGITSEFDINNFSLDNIEKIEIVKGAQSTLYGSDAVAGVINLISKKGANHPLSANANLSAGSYGTYKGSISLSGGNNKGTHYFISYDRIHSNGFSSAYDSTGKANFEKDGFDQDAVRLNYSLQPFKGGSLSVFGRYNYNHAAIDGGPFIDDRNYTYHNDNTIAGAVLDYHLKKGMIRAQYNINFYNRNFLDDTTTLPRNGTYQKGTYNGTSHFAEVYANLHPSKNWELLAGVDYRRFQTRQIYIYYPDYGYPVTPISPDSARASQVSGYGSVFYKSANGFNLDLGGRWNYHSVYGNNFTYTFNPFWMLGGKYKLYVNIASAYKVPSLYQLYAEFGNRSLKPERTSSEELGLQYGGKKFSGRITGFLRNGRDIILFYTDPVTYNSQYINGDKQHDYGLETEASYVFSSRLKLSLNYTYVDGKVTTLTGTGKDTSYFNLYKRPASIFNAVVAYKPGASWYLSLHLKTVSKAYEGQYMGPPYVLNPYYTLDLYGKYRLSKKVAFFADLQNITNQHYFVTRGYTTKGFNMNAGVQVHL
ncbi:MAG: TonB-dependent receptor [Bacteroidota bacterium]|nr:TonB-dependent receptor [Bacteroidota bacterium]